MAAAAVLNLRATETPAPENVETVTELNSPISVMLTTVIAEPLTMASRPAHPATAEGLLACSQLLATASRVKGLVSQQRASVSEANIPVAIIWDSSRLRKHPDSVPYTSASVTS